MPTPSTRRSFFGLAAGAGLLCTIGGREVRLDRPRAAARADAAAARVPRPRALTQADPVDALKFPTPQPQPGVRYNPDYDGTYLGEHTRIGGFVPTTR